MKGRPRWPSCPYCGCQFSRRSMAIHQVQCVKKMEKKIETLPPELRNRMLNRHRKKKPGGRRRKGRSTGRGRGSGNIGRDNRKIGGGNDNFQWMEQSDMTNNGPMNLIPCKYCNRKFFLERIQKHESVCTERKNKKRRKFNSLKQRIHEEVSIRHVVNEKRKDRIQKKRGVRRRIKKKSNWREQHREFIKNIRNAKEWERSRKTKTRHEGHRFSGGRSSGYGGGGGVQVYASSRNRGGVGGGFSGNGGFSGGISGKSSGSDLSRYQTNRGSNRGFVGHRRPAGNRNSKSSRLSSTNISKKFKPSLRNRQPLQRKSKVQRPSTSSVTKRRRNRTTRTNVNHRVVEEEEEKAKPSNFGVKRNPRFRGRKKRNTFKEENPMTKSFDEILMFNKLNENPKKTRRVGKRKVNRTTGESSQRSTISSFTNLRKAPSDTWQTSSSSYGACYGGRTSGTSRTSSNLRNSKPRVRGRKKVGRRPTTSSGIRY